MSTNRQREEGRDNIEAEGKKGLLNETMCEKLFKIVKHYRIFKIFHLVKKNNNKNRGPCQNRDKLCLV